MQKITNAQAIEEDLQYHTDFVTATELYYDAPDYYDQHDLTPHDIVEIIQTLRKKQ